MIKRRESSFVWDKNKELENIKKHRMDFNTTSEAFYDPQRKIFIDSKHSKGEKRYFCIGMVKGKIVTVRFTYREGKIRIIGAGYWRKGAK